MIWPCAHFVVSFRPQSYDQIREPPKKRNPRSSAKHPYHNLSDLQDPFSNPRLNSRRQIRARCYASLH